MIPSVNKALFNVAATKKALQETGLSARYLRLEITETSAMHDLEHTILTLIDFLKIDRAF